MNSRSYLTGLAINTDLSKPDKANYSLPSWPPPMDFPVVIDSDNNVVSRISHSTWDLSLWARKSCKISFYDEPNRVDTKRISTENAYIFRLIVAWWLWGLNSVQTPATLKARHNQILPVFIICSENNISVTELHKFPAVWEKLYYGIPRSRAEPALMLFHTLLEQRDQIGFTILNRECLRRLEASLPAHQARQTPYIPPRIWNYQICRLKECIDDFHRHKEQIKECFHYCLEHYKAFYGDWSSVYKSSSVRRSDQSTPFCSRRDNRRKCNLPIQTFYQVATRFGIIELLERWTNDRKNQPLHVSSLAALFTLVSRASLAYVINFSLMRIEEAWRLRANCLIEESDPILENILIVEGETTKTINENDARWIVSPGCKKALEIASTIAKLRAYAASLNPDLTISNEDLTNPYLSIRSYEPWGNSKNQLLPASILQIYPSYKMLHEDYHKLFNRNELRITEKDLVVARLINPDLDLNLFSTGRVWTLTWHQLRRTGAVNMQSTGLIRDSSVQYQLKHSTRAMSRYYGQGHASLTLNNETRTLYLRTMYEVLAKELASLFTERFVSPYGNERKGDILKTIHPSDLKNLAKEARRGDVSLRETLLGVCTMRGACEHGGIDNIARCAGGDGNACCAHALYDKDKEDTINDFKLIITSRLESAPARSPYREALEAQLKAAESYLNVINK